MAKKKAAVKKVGGKVVGKKKGKKSRRLDLLGQDSSAYVVFDKADKTGGFLRPVVITVKATAKDCNCAPVSIEDFGFDATYNTVPAREKKVTTDPADPAVATLRFEFPSWADNVDTRFDEELVITVLTKKSVTVGP